MTYKLNPDLLQKLRNGEIAIDNRGNPNYILLKQVLRDAFPRETFEPNGSGLFYYAVNGSTEWTGTDTCDSISTIPLNDFIQKGVVVGYKVKPEYAEAVQKIMCLHSLTLKQINEDIATFSGHSEWVEYFTKLGVLDLWFDEITEEPKEEKNSVFVEQQRMITRMTLIQIVLNDGIPQSIIEGLVQEYDK